MTTRTLKKVKDIQVGDKVKLPINRFWGVCEDDNLVTVSSVIINPHFGWIGFTVFEWPNDDFNFYGWMNPDDQMICETEL